MNLFVLDCLDTGTHDADWSPVGVMLLDSGSVSDWWKQNTPLLKWLRLMFFDPAGETLIRFGVYDFSGRCVHWISFLTTTPLSEIEAAAGLRRCDDGSSLIINKLKGNK